MEIKERVYEALNGFYAEEEDYLIEGIEVKDAFIEGSELNKCGEIIQNSKEKLRSILSESMYDEVEVIDMRYNQLMREVAYRMFEYGLEFGKNK